MKRGKQIDTWYPFYIDKWLFGSTRHELIIRDEKGNFIEDLRGIFADLLTLSKKDGGYIRANEDTPYPLAQLAGMFCVPEEKLQRVIDICQEEKVKKIKQTAPGIYYVLSTKTYSLTERHRRRMTENPDTMSEEPDNSQKKEDIRVEEKKGEERREQKSPSPYNFRPRHRYLAMALEASIKENVPFHVFTGASHIEAWAHEFRIMEGTEKRGQPDKGIPFKKIAEVLEWSQVDPFWRKNILSAVTFRSKFGRLEADSRDPQRGSNKEEALGREKRVGRRPTFEEGLIAAARAALPEIDAEFDSMNRNGPPAGEVEPRNEYRARRLAEIFG